ncbi:putative peptidoglycan binding protein [Natranaerovirga hydrolytica]|uniref:Putative peptidoglycan binding protein n=1 Tax=Natranaerovirga hydrolytica TaxID=680378 RepID=A0A4R1MME8_9FIRM|nr:peptidoglycan-binding protein [Natranaerovirga hydrolytica]TCK92454.1 putative peptidoglycan binding protein [Natranaerovirga hydrolytica]
MHKKMIYPAQMDTQSFGRLEVNVRTDLGFNPIEDAEVTISRTGVPNSTIEVLNTNVSGKTPVIDLETPPIDYSLEPTAEQPYSEYTITVRSEGLETVVVNGSQILPEEKAIQDVEMPPNNNVNGVNSQQLLFNEEGIVIGPHTLFFQYPPKIPEDEVKSPAETGEIVLPEPVIPEFIIVHDGPPDDAGAPNYWVRFKDYIKNVASSEIYATWPESTIQSNTLAILSFTLNRVFTEWYRGKGYNFTITSSTAFDQMWMYGRNIYENISQIVDALFVNYLARPNIIQPILTQYCDGVQVQCPGWMTQWGSKYLGDEGRNAIEIIRNFYGDDMYLETAPRVSGVPASWPGFNLQVGTTGEEVRIIQDQLNAIANNYPAIPRVRVDGNFGEETRDAVAIFQDVFNLPPNGIVDYPTWYRISDIYVAVTRIAELM